jgi:8-amino-3,8-dideoxy-alpha-D-manno-octulosonate transaminase
MPDPQGDSCTFLSWFLPGEEEARAVIDELKAKNARSGQLLLVR